MACAATSSLDGDGPNTDCVKLILADGGITGITIINALRKSFSLNRVMTVPLLYYLFFIRVHPKFENASSYEKS